MTPIPARTEGPRQSKSSTVYPVICARQERRVDRGIILRQTAAPVDRVDRVSVAAKRSDANGTRVALLSTYTTAVLSC